MPVTAGTYTVGAGGNYATWADAFADISSPLTGDLTLVLVSNIFMSANALKTINPNGFNFICTSASAPNGNFARGYVTSLDYNVGIRTQSDGAGQIIIANQYVLATRSFGQVNTGWELTSTANMPVFTGPGGGSLVMFSCLLDGNNSFAGGGTLAQEGGNVGLYVDCANQSTVFIYNVMCIRWKFRNFYLRHTGSGSRFENLTAYWCENTLGTSAGVSYDLGNVGMRPTRGNMTNVVSFGVANNRCFFADESGASNVNFESCSSGDTSAVGNNIQHNVSDFSGTFWRTPLDGNSVKEWWLKLRPGSPLQSSGAGGLTAGNTTGIRGNARPGDDGLYSRGADEWAPLDAPTVTNVSPNNGPASGGNTVTVTGTNFFPQAHKVYFGGVLATSTWINSTQISCVVPAHAAGPVTVTVEIEDGQQGSLVNAYTYIAGPDITAVNPTFGPKSGGNTITVTGTNFSNPATVLFGSTSFGFTASPSVTWINSTQLSVVVPADPLFPGNNNNVDVRVMNADGQIDTLPLSYVYVAPPAFSFVSFPDPAQGPTHGGTAFQIVGQNFNSGVQVFFDNILALNIVRINSSTLEGDTPFNGAGPADIKIQNTDGQFVVAAAAWTYIAQNYVISGAIDAQALLSEDADLIDTFDLLAPTMDLVVNFRVNRVFNIPGDGNNLMLVPVNVTTTGVSGDPFIIAIYAATIFGAAQGTAQLTVTFTVATSFSGGAAATRTITGTAQLDGTLNFLGALRGEIVHLGELTYSLTGGFVVDRAGASSREAEYDGTGYRRSFPFLVYALHAKNDVDIAGVPPNRSFLVAADFLPSPGDPFSEQGAGANYIGTKIVPASGPAYLVFRKPEEWEVVYFVLHARHESCLYRYELNRDTGRFGWNEYHSQPQRNLSGQYAFSIFDPDGIYEYYACMWGGLYFEWSYDSQVLALQYDADKCSRFYLPALAANFGFTLKHDDPLLVKRQKVKNAVPSFKFKGLEKGVELRLLSLGYRGYVREIWVNPGAKQWELRMNYNGTAGNVPLVYKDAVFPHITVVGFKGGGDNVPARAYIQFRRGRTPFSPNLGEVSPETFEKIIISDGTITKTFEFIQVLDLGDPITTSDPSFIGIKFLKFENIDDTATRFMAAVAAVGFNFTIIDRSRQNNDGPPIGDEPNSASDTGALDSTDPAARSDYLELPHGYMPDEPDLYWPSTRVAIHLNDRQGRPIDVTEEIKQIVSQELLLDVLPVQCDIRYFATDISLSEPAEKIAVAETFTITEVP